GSGREEHAPLADERAAEELEPARPASEDGPSARYDLEVAREGEGGGVAVLRVARERALADAADPGARGSLVGPGGALGEDLGVELERALREEGVGLREEPEEHDPERVDVGPSVEVERAHDLLGRHVERRAEPVAVGGEARLPVEEAR